MILSVKREDDSKVIVTKHLKTENATLFEFNDTNEEAFLNWRKLKGNSHNDTCSCNTYYYALGIQVEVCYLHLFPSVVVIFKIK